MPGPGICRQDEAWRTARPTWMLLDTQTLRPTGNRSRESWTKLSTNGYTSKLAIQCCKRSHSATPVMVRETSSFHSPEAGRPGLDYSFAKQVEQHADYALVGHYAIMHVHARIPSLLASYTLLTGTSILQRTWMVNFTHAALVGLLK